VQTISAASTNLAASHDRKFLRFTHETATLTIQTDEDAEYPESLMAAGHAENAMTIVAAFGVTIDGENAAEVSIPAGGCGWRPMRSRWLAGARAAGWTRRNWMGPSRPCWGTAAATRRRRSRRRFPRRAR